MCGVNRANLTRIVGIDRMVEGIDVEGGVGLLLGRHHLIELPNMSGER